MAFRELKMTDVREVLRRWQAGQSAREIARANIVDRKTAGRYAGAAKVLGIETDTALTDDVVRTVADAVQARPKPPPSRPWAEFEQHRAQIESWLKDRLRLVRVHELLQREGVEGSYSTLWRYAHEELGWRERPTTVRIDDPPPGDEVQVDFGKMGCVEMEDGKRRTLWVLIVTLSMSRHMFVWPVFRQTLDELVAGLDAAWQFFGGVPRHVVIDNMAAAVVRAHPTSPELNRSFTEYAQSCGFFVDAARVRRPKDKPRVENQVPYVRERWFDGEVFAPSLAAIRTHAAAWCREIAGRRIHGTTRRVPLEVFESEEQASLLPAPTEPFDVPKWQRAKLHPDHHAQVDRGLYSAPTRYIGQTFDVRIDRRSVQMYLGHTLVKMHQRVGPGERSTDPDDYPSDKADLAFRKVDGVKRRAQEHGQHVGAYAERLLDGPLPWTKMRQGYQLVRLCERYGAERVNSLCARALAFDVIDVPRIERMLKKAQKVEPIPEGGGRVISLPKGRFERDPAVFATMKSTTGDGGES